MAAGLLQGLLPEARGVTDPEFARALDERAELLRARADELVGRALTTPGSWAEGLVEPVDPAARAVWLERLATVAAYRDRHAVTVPEPVAPERDDWQHDADARRARGALEDAERLAGSRTVPSASAHNGPNCEQTAQRRGAVSEFMLS